MSYPTERDQTIYELSRAGFAMWQTRTLLRHATTLHRLAEAQCNGDWPADNGERKVTPCPQCESLWVPSSLKRYHGKGEAICPDCRSTAHVHETIHGTGYQATVNGDPRGCVLVLYPESATREDIDSGRAQGRIAIVGRY